MTRPAWASGIGRDRFGLWAEFTIGESVRQRLRWIPPGRFVMGSPPGEQGRYSDEGQRTLRIAEGFWLFVTPCSQTLWEAVMGENPSRFRSPTRPVEQVSWTDCQGFAKKLNGLLDGLTLSLPSEAQWEYACRAGTATATYAGDLEILGANNAPVLDGIAWYGGNCGVDFELEEGWDISDWPEKQYDRKKGGTHPVGLKAPNGWGLYDMLGNVFEWCQDGYGAEEGAAGERSRASSDQVVRGGWWSALTRLVRGKSRIEDVHRAEEGTEGERSRASAPRVIRGGSWYGIARRVRAASRLGFRPGGRNRYLGFRCGEFRVGEEERGGEPS
jgi:formylglycine-generating enzyme required for sulfatase activity